MKKARTPVSISVALALSIIAGRMAGAESPTPLVAIGSTDAFTVTGGQAQAVGGQAIKVSGSEATSLVFSPKSGLWDLSKRESIRVRLRNPSDHAVAVLGRAENPDAEKLMNASRNAVELLAGEEGSLVIRLTRRPEDPTYKPFEPYYMYYKGINVRDNTVDPSKISRLVLTVEHWAQGQSIEILGIDAEGEGVPAPVPFLPFVDKYGQYTHGDWPGKIYDDGDFSARVKEEKRAQSDWSHPKEWDEYGGWAQGPSLKATGHFYVAKHEGKWWFVDPVGHLFWSYGPTGVGYGGDITPYSGRENWFVELPTASDALLAPFLHGGHGATYQYYQDRDWKGMDIQRVNLMRKYGPAYEQRVAEVSHDRLHSWGFNSIGNWSDPKVYGLHRTPYVVPIDVGGPKIYYRFEDVYDPAWEPALRAAMERQRGTTADDPWCIGYFVDNERWYGWRPRAAAIGEETLKNPPQRAAKIKMVEMLKERYTAVEALNEAWKTKHATWDAVLASSEEPDMKNDAILKDCGDFGMMFAERYASVSREVVKSVAPNNLFLGSRLFGHTDPEVVRLLSKYWDVISYNIYDNPPTGRVNQYKALDLPILSTEWGIESDPLQTPFRDEKLTAPSPAERAAQVEKYVRAALANPNMVGAHFFQFRDQPLTGRPDGEATLRGFVNVADTPNFNLVETNRRLAYQMYETRSQAK